MSDDFLLVEDSASLEQFCQQIEGAAWLAIDTEFEREKTYYPELCLLQIATPEVAAVIDPIAIEDLAPLMTILYDENIVKVFHSARQDLEIFYNMNNKVPAPLFDTQVAAPLLGYPEQAGYATLVKSIEGVELSKSHTRTDWKQRPLKSGQLRYAVDDVIYLAKIYQKILNDLTSKGRLKWLDQDFIEMTDPAIYNPDPNRVWTRIRSANRLKSKKLVVLQTLAKWREETARKENIPRNWVLRDDAITDIANQLPTDKRDLYSVKSLPDRQVGRYGARIIKLIEEADQAEPQDLPEHKRKVPLNVNQEMLLDLMSVIVRQRASENEMNHIVLAPNKELDKLVRGEASLINSGWRAHMVGEDLQQLLNGEISVTVVDQRVQLQQK